MLPNIRRSAATYNLRSEYTQLARIIYSLYTAKGFIESSFLLPRESRHLRNLKSISHRMRVKLTRPGLVAVLAINVLSVGQACADDKVNFSKMVSDPVELQQVLRIAKQSGVVVNNPCPSANFSILNRFAFFKPMAFDDSGRPIQGAWKQSVAEKGCGRELLLNVFFDLDSSSHAVKAMPLFPGTTRANPILQKDAMPHAAMAAQWPEKNCQHGYMENTEFLKEIGEPLEGTTARPWDELWTLTSCTKKAKVTLHFIPDKTGTTIHTSLQETTFLPNESAQ